MNIDKINDGGGALRGWVVFISFGIAGGRAFQALGCLTPGNHTAPSFPALGGRYTEQAQFPVHLMEGLPASGPTVLVITHVQLTSTSHVFPVHGTYTSHYHSSTLKFINIIANTISDRLKGGSLKSLVKQNIKVMSHEIEGHSRDYGYK